MFLERCRNIYKMVFKRNIENVLYNIFLKNKTNLEIEKHRLIEDADVFFLVLEQDDLK